MGCATPSRLFSATFVVIAAAWALSSACSTPSVPPASPSALAASRSEDEELDRVAAIHGAPGPWAVAGYRMGRFALAKLSLSSGSFDLDVTHHTPREVMYSCIADGAAAATGASAGKLNLNLVESDVSGVATSYRRKSTGQVVTLRPTSSFRARFADTPRDKARELGRTVLRLPDVEIFDEIPGRAPP